MTRTKDYWEEQQKLISDLEYYKKKEKSYADKVKDIENRLSDFSHKVRNTKE